MLTFRESVKDIWEFFALFLQFFCKSKIISWLYPNKINFLQPYQVNNYNPNFLQEDKVVKQLSKNK